MPREKPSRKKLKPESTDLKEYLERLPPPPEEHAHELKMEQRLKRLLAKQGELSEGELRYYSRQIMLDSVGHEGQMKLKNAKVCIVGLGGLGSTIATQLTAMGVGHLKLVDRDVVEESNLQRQHLYSFDVIGFPKVEAAVKRLEWLNPYVEFEPLPVSLNADNAEAILGDADVVVDGLDNMSSRYAINRACVRLGKPYVFGAAISTYGNASTIIPRKTPCLECFYGKLDDRGLPSCATVGIHPSVLGVVASVEVAETIKIILRKQPALEGKLLYCDISLMRFEEIELARAENCPVCGLQPTTIPKPLKRVLVEESCGRNGKRVFVTLPKENLKLEIGNLISLLKRDKIRFLVEANLGATFTPRKGIRISILKSGIMIAEGTQSKEETLDTYKTILKKLHIPWSRVE